MYFDGATISPVGKRKKKKKEEQVRNRYCLRDAGQCYNPPSLALMEGCSNNETEYEALIAGLELALEASITRLQVFGDSELVIKQVNGAYIVKRPTLVPRAKHLVRQFPSI